MPRQAGPPRLWKRQERRDKAGHITHAATWIILDGGRQFSTGIDAGDIDGANRALVAHINRQYTAAIMSGPRPTSAIPVADVLTLYARDVVPRHANPKEAIPRLRRLGAFFSAKHLSDINGPLCRSYADKQTTVSIARRDLEELRAAINHHLKEGLHDQIVSVVMPARLPPRERWLTRAEVARLVKAAWNHREKYAGEAGTRHTRRHIARFILVALYTGSRASVVTQASFLPEIGRPYIDLDRGVFYRRPPATTETRKRRPAIPLPTELLAHLRRWHRAGQRYVVQWNRQPVRRITGAFNRVVSDVGLGSEVTPHILRHTAATWMMQAGTDPWQASGYLGMSLQTLQRVYGHHHPDHLEDARRAFRKHSAKASPTINVNRAGTFVRGANRKAR